MASISYELSKFNPTPSSELLCAICYCVLHDPRMCPCHHIFCNECIKRWLENSDTCPTCRCAVNLEQLKMAPPLVQNVLNSLTMDCDYKDQGCDQSITMEQFPLHIANCDLKPARCPHAECTARPTVRDLPAHKEECQYRSVQCQKQCHLMFPFYKLDNHDCITAMQDRIGDLDVVIHRHQLAMTWIRKKLNFVQLPEQSAGVQLQAYREMITDINQYWLEDEPIPLLLCGTYMAPTPPHEVMARTSTAILEQLISQASNPNLPRLFGPRDPEGADGPTAHLVRNTPVRGVVRDEDIENLDGFSRYSSDSDTSSVVSAYHRYLNAESSAYSTPNSSRSQSGSPHYPASDRAASESRENRSYDGDSPRQDGGYVHGSIGSPEQSRSGFDGDGSLSRFDSSDFDSFDSDHDNFASTLRSSSVHSHPYSPSSYLNSSNSARHLEEDDAVYDDWNYASQLTDYEQDQADSHYFSRSRSRSRSPHDMQDYDRRSRSRSRSYSSQRSWSDSRSRSRSSEDSRTGNGYLTCYSPSPNRRRSRSFSRSPVHRQIRSRSHSGDDLDDDNIDSQDYLLSRGYWPKRYDVHTGLEGNHANRNFDSENRFPGDEARNEHDQNFVEELTPVYDRIISDGSSSHETRRRNADSTSTFLPYIPGHLPGAAETVERRPILSTLQLRSLSYQFLSSRREGFHDTNSHSAFIAKETREQTRQDHLQVDTASNDKHFTESDAPWNAGHILIYPNPEASTSQNIQPGDRSEDFVVRRKNPDTAKCDDDESEDDRQALQHAAPGCSYHADDTAVTVQEKGTTGKERKYSDQDTSRNVWESSSDTTSLDYDIPAEDPPTQSASQREPGTESNSVNRENKEENGNHTSLNAVNQSGSESLCNAKGKKEGKGSGKPGSSKNVRKSVNNGTVGNRHKHMSKSKTRKNLHGKGKSHLKTNSTAEAPVTEFSDNSGSDSVVCFKRKTKVKLPDTSSDSEESSRENDQTNHKPSDVVATQSNLPSTSHTNSLSSGVKVKAKEDKRESSNKEKRKHSTNQLKAVSQPKQKAQKRKRPKSKKHLPAKVPRKGSSSSSKEVKLTQNVGNNSSLALKASTAHVNSDLHVTSHSQVLATSHGLEGDRWTSHTEEHPRRTTTRSHTYSRHDLSDRTYNGTDSIDLTSGPSDRRLHESSSRSEETQTRRTSERRVVALSSSRRGENSSTSTTSTRHQERDQVNPPVHTGGRRIMRIDNRPSDRLAPRRPVADDSRRTVVIADLPVPPTTLELLNQFDDSDETDSTWSPSSSNFSNI